MQDYVSNPLFTQGEVQQLRSLLRENISSLEVCAENDREYAKELKDQYADSSLIDFIWYRHFKARAKIKKLAALQVKLKSQDVLY